MLATLRLTFRGLSRAPVFSAVAILSLALGIGANTAIFSLIDQMLLRRLPVRDPHQLVYLYQPGPVQGSSSTDEPGMPAFSYPMFREMQAEIAKGQTSVAALAASRSQSVSLSYKNAPASGSARLVSGNYFEMLGVGPALGRVIAVDDENVPAAVLGHAYWTSRFGAQVSVLNEPILVNGFRMTIVGVTRKGFSGERLGDEPDVYLPAALRKEITPDWDGLRDRQNYWITLLARLRPGVTIQQAEADLNTIYRPQLARDVELLRAPRKDFLDRFRAKRIVLKPGASGRGPLRDEGSRPLYLLLAMTGLALLICCANVANLQLARSAARVREIAVRLAMGASRAQLIRQLLVESIVLAGAGGVCGLLVSYATIRGIIAAIPPSTISPAFFSASLDARVLLFSLALSATTGILFGLYPALHSSKTNLSTALKDQAGQTTAGGSANLFRKSLVTAQVAVSLLLLVGAGMLGRSLLNLSRIELGLRADHLLSFAVNPRLNQYTDQRTALFYEQLTERLRALPGVRLVSSARVPAIAGSNSSTNVTVEGFASQSIDGDQSSFNSVGPDYFRTLGMALAAGREFSAADHATAPKVAVVNEAFVRHFLGGRNPIGQRMARGASSKTKLEIEIVGVAKDAKYSDIRQAPPKLFFTPAKQEARQGALFFYLRTDADPAKLAPLVRREVAALDSNLPIRQLKSMQVQIEENLFAERLMSALTAIFAGLATLLASVGLYGVMAFNVARRTREFGIRMALGAPAGAVRALLAREVAVMVAAGTLVGAAAALASGRFLQTLLYAVEPWDAVSIGLAVLTMWLVASAAAYVPARRATRVDPMVALRYE